MYSVQPDYFFLLPLAFAYVMMVAGVKKRMLQWRRDPHACRSCGRSLRECTCYH
ncbi:MAG TPA: hypothetical protein VH538_02725 [Gaiellaceae bacterium]|jgi:hypothetical protein